MKILSAIFLITSGCTIYNSSLIDGCQQDLKQPKVSYQIYLDLNFSSEHQELIQEAVQDWENSVDGLVAFEYTENWREISNLIVISPTTIAEVSILYDHFSYKGNDIAGLTTHWDDVTLIQVSIDPSETPEYFRQMVEHELGHAFGLEHTEKGDLMYSSQDGAAMNVTCNDVEQFCSIWNCEPNKLTGCLQPDSCKNGKNY